MTHSHYPVQRILLIVAGLMVLLISRANCQIQSPKPLRAGIIGLDTSHVVEFTATLNTKNLPETAGIRVVAAYPTNGSPDIPRSVERVADFTAKVRAMGVQIVDSVEALVSQVDVVLLETVDGRRHLEQLRPCLAARKPVFIDKPVAASLADTVRIFAEAKAAGVPVFCSSALRFGKQTQAVAKGSIGKVTYAEATSPATLEPHHVDLYWYGVHGCESLYTVMGTGCKSVRRGTTANGKIEVKGDWGNGRTGIYRESVGYGGTATGAKGKAPIGSLDGYDVLLFEIAKFFRTGTPPVTAEETTELYAFMDAADESKRRGGTEVSLSEVLARARSPQLAALAASGNIKIAPRQSPMETLSQQAPNAIEWALAPLEQAVPGDIRQNLTFLREDLLTETQDKPKLSATRDAGAKLCDAIIGVLDERKLTLAKAGFRAVEANARTGVTSQALEARRNYKMSWPQFAREESQRAELKSQAIGNAQVIAERPKLDWAQRTAALQKPLDDLYRQYCEALRQSAK